MGNFFKTRVFQLCCFVVIGVAFGAAKSSADHLSRDQCENYFQCVLGMDSAVNRCNDNAYLKKIRQTKVMCIRIAQHECKKSTGILWTGK